MTRSMRAAVVAGMLLLPGSLLLARAELIVAKGALGEVLIRRALAATLRDGHARRPWPWADMHPVARLRVPRLGVDRPVLSNASGAALAFGIGVVGPSVLAGHRDSWASFLEDVRIGDDVIVEAFEGLAVYRVASTAIVRFDDARVLEDDGGDRLTLVTCWPFRGWLHSPLRYVVRAELQTGSPRIESPNVAQASLGRTDHPHAPLDRSDAHVGGRVGFPSGHRHD